MKKIMTPERWSLAYAFAFSLTACATAAVNEEADPQAIRSASNSFQHALATRDLEAVVGMFTPDAVLMVAHSPVAAGSPAVRERVRGILGLRALSLILVPARIDLLGPTGAVEYGTYTFSFETPTGRVNDAGSYLNVWRTVDGQWRLATHAVVTTGPPP